MFEKFKKFTSAVNTKACVASATVSSMLCPVAFAGGSVDTTADAIMGTILGYVCSIFRYIGVLLLAWSVGMLVLAFKNEDADSKSRAMMMLVVSIILICLKTAVEAVLKVTNTGITIK